LNKQITLNKVGLIQLVKALIRKNWPPPSVEGILPLDSFWNWIAALPWVSLPPVCSAEFGLSSLYTIYLLLVLFLWRTLTKTSWDVTIERLGNAMQQKLQSGKNNSLELFSCGICLLNVCI
jgi:hypothetical protein